MNRQPPTSPANLDPPDEPLHGALREAVEQIRAKALPQDTMTRTLERAAALRRPKPFWRRSMTACLCAACLALAVLGGWTTMAWINRPAPDDATPVAVTPHRIEAAPEPDSAPTAQPAPLPAPQSAPPPPPAPPKVDPLKVYGQRIAKLGTTSHNDGLNRFGTIPTTAAGLTSGGLTAGTSPVPFMAVAADAPVLVASGGPKPIRLGDKVPYDPTKDTTLHIWDWSKSSESRPIKLAKPPGGMAVSPDGKWIVTRDGRQIDVADGAVRQLDNFAGEVHGMLFAPDGRSLLLTIRGANQVSSARVLDFPSGKKRFEIPDQWWYTFAGTFSPDNGTFFLMDKDRFVCGYDATNGKQLRRYEPAFTNSIRAITVSADGKQVAAAASAPVDAFLWEIASGKLLHKLAPKQKFPVYSETGIEALAFAPDGKLLAGAGAYSVVLWDTADGKAVRLFPRASGNASGLRFAKDGKTLTSIHPFYGYGVRGKERDNVLIYPAVHLWDVATGEERKLISP